jgi:hypothetical protein
MRTCWLPSRRPAGSGATAGGMPGEPWCEMELVIDSRLLLAADP